MKCGFDIDGVVCDFVSGARDGSKNIGLDLSDKNIMSEYHSKPDAYENMLADEAFWLNLKPIRSSWHFINDIFYKGHDVFFITSRFKDEAISVTERWLDEWGFMFCKVLFTENATGKARAYESLDLDFFVDDLPSVASAVASVGSAYILKHPYIEDSISRPVAYEYGVKEIMELKELYGIEVEK